MELALAEIGPLVDGSLEVLVVDDGSSDRTPELADALAAADPRVRVHHQPNRGYGGALKSGFARGHGASSSASPTATCSSTCREMQRLLDRLADAARRSTR